MLVIGIDTSGHVVAGVLLKGEEVLASAAVRAGRRGAPCLGRLLDGLLARVGRLPGDLEGVAAAVGPGPYTAVRVGLAAAAGLALAVGCPVCGVPTPEALMRGRCRRNDFLVAVLDAGRGQVWATGSGPGGAPLRGVLDSPEGLLDRLRGRPAVLFGPGADRYRERFLAGIGPDRVLRLPDEAVAEGVARLGRSALEAGEPGALEPLYLRPPDALVRRVRG
jgi:tRNA threonylcarbamoyladenosine biosynthesis protein TsaB